MTSKGSFYGQTYTEIASDRRRKYSVVCSIWEGLTDFGLDLVFWANYLSTSLRTSSFMCNQIEKAKMSLKTPLGLLA